MRIEPRQADQAATTAVKPRIARGPDGVPLSPHDLPPAGSARFVWTTRRKAVLLCAIDGGLITRDEALARYRMSIEELATWRRDVRRHGVAGLMATRLRAASRDGSGGSSA